MIPYDYDQEDWGSTRVYSDGDLPGLWVPDKTVIHWGGLTIAEDDIEWEMSRLRFWQRYHISGKGWRDIAYNTAIGQSGNIYRCRGDNPSGATSGDYEDDGIPENNEAHAIVWIGGKYTAGGPSADALEAFDMVIRALGFETVIGHMDVTQRECPGPDLMDYIAARGWNTNPDPEVAEDMFCKRGDTSETVAYWQLLLQSLGYEFNPVSEFFGGTLVLALKSLGFSGEKIGAVEAAYITAKVGPGSQDLSEYVKYGASLQVVGV